MKAYWGSGSIAPRILALGTRWMWSASGSGRFILRERHPPPGTHWIGGWTDSRTGMDAGVKRKPPDHRNIVGSVLPHMSDNCKKKLHTIAGQSESKARSRKVMKDMHAL
jgi:hypothetical protein